MTVFTIDYEGLDIDRFMALLAEHGVDTVVDIREYAAQIQHIRAV